MGRIVYHYRVTCYRRVAGRRDTQQGQHARETHARCATARAPGRRPRARAARPRRRDRLKSNKTRYKKPG